MRENTKKTVYLCAASFLLSVLSSLSAGLPLVPEASACACAGCFAVAALASPSKAHLVVIPAATLCAFALSGSISQAIVAIAPFLIGVSIAYSARARDGRTGAIIRCDIILFVVVIVAAAAEYYIANGTLASSAVVNSIKEFFDSIEKEVVDMFDKAGIYESYSGFFDASSYTKEQLLTSLAKDAVFSLKVLSPAIIITALNIISYVSTAFFSVVSRTSKTEIAIPGGKWRVIPSTVSAWMFLISFTVYFVISLMASFTGAAATGISTFASVVEYAALNVALILVPAMLVCGIRGLVAKFRLPMLRRRAIITVVIAGVLIILNPLVFGPIYAAIFVSVDGAWDVISYHRAKKYGKDQ